MKWDGATLLQFIFSAGVMTVFVAVINGLLQRRKVGADTTKVITDAATGVMSRIESDNERLRSEAIGYRTREDVLEDHIDRLGDERAEWMRIARQHGEWDDLVFKQVAEHCPTLILPVPPPLSPDKFVPRHPPLKDPNE